MSEINVIQKNQNMTSQSQYVIRVTQKNLREKFAVKLFRECICVFFYKDCYLLQNNGKVWFKTLHVTVYFVYFTPFYDYLRVWNTYERVSAIVKLRQIVRLGISKKSFCKKTKTTQKNNKNLTFHLRWKLI